MPVKNKKVTPRTSTKKTPAKKPSTRTRTQAAALPTESDGVYFLKIVLYVVLGSFWLKFGQPLEFAGFAINALPVGLLIGLILINFDRFQVDRKIEYALLVVVTIMSYFLPAGILI